MFENIISKNIAIRVIIFKELLKEMLSNLNIIKATNRPKLLEKLEELQVQLNFCEKALADYLETKRLIYPRFYFISAADLLDILSNGQKTLIAINNSYSLFLRKRTIEKWYIFATKMIAYDKISVTSNFQIELAINPLSAGYSRPMLSVRTARVQR